MFKAIITLCFLTSCGFLFKSLFMTEHNSHLADTIKINTLVIDDSSVDENPLLKTWTGQYGGYPAFNTVQVKDFIPAFDVAMKTGLEEVDKIANNPSPPTFENTMVELEKSGQTMSRLMAIYGVWSSTMNSNE